MAFEKVKKGNSFYSTFSKLAPKWFISSAVAWKEAGDLSAGGRLAFGRRLCEASTPPQKISRLYSNVTENKFLSDSIFYFPGNCCIVLNIQPKN